MRFDTIHAINNPQISTPHIDSLVKRGVTFTRAHIMGGTSGAVCMPSRAMLLTGRTLFRIYNRGASIPVEQIMFPEMLRDAGYQTFGTGKWHNGRESYARCFTAGGSIFFGGMSDHLSVPAYDFDPSGEYPKNKVKIREKFSSELFSDEAIRFLENYDSDNPFLLYISFTAPHDPRMAPKEFQEMYPIDQIQIPENFLPGHPFDNGEMNVRDENLAAFPRTKKEIRQHLADYYAMISHLDAQIGRVLDVLEKKGESENTIIVFTSDNGLAVGQHGLLGKQNIYDHSVRIPLIICGPGIPQKKQTDSLCYLSDIFPTFCGLLNLPVPETVEGKSLIPALKDSDKKIYDSVFLAYRKFQRGIRTDDNWKLIKYNVRGRKTTQLFDLNADPMEKNNLESHPDSKEKKETMTTELKKLMRDLDDFCDLELPNWGLHEEKYEITSIDHKGVGKPVRLLNYANPRYSNKGVKALVDGVQASAQFKDGYWLGLQGEDLEAEVDLGNIQSLNRIELNFLENQESWIFLPESVEILISSDGREFAPIKKTEIETQKNIHTVIHPLSTEARGKKARFIRVLAKSIGLCPPWHPGAGENAWIFIDEIIIL